MTVSQIIRNVLLLNSNLDDELQQREGMEEEKRPELSEELVHNFRSKSDIYNYLSLKSQLFLPPYSEAKLGKWNFFTIK